MQSSSASSAAAARHKTRAGVVAIPIGDDSESPELINESRPRTRSLSKGIKELFRGARSRSGSGGSTTQDKSPLVKDSSPTPTARKDGSVGTAPAGGPGTPGSTRMYTGSNPVPPPAHWSKKIQNQQQQLAPPVGGGVGGGRPRSRSEVVAPNPDQLRHLAATHRQHLQLQPSTGPSGSPSMDSSRTPMSQLLLSSAAGSASAMKTRVGPDEFMELYKSHAYNSGCNGELKSAAGRQRRHSEFRAPTLFDNSSSNASPSTPPRNILPADRGLQPPAVGSSCLTQLSSSPKLVLPSNHSLPQTIPEHGVMKLITPSDSSSDRRGLKNRFDAALAAGPRLARRVSIAATGLSAADRRRVEAVNGRGVSGDRNNEEDDELSDEAWEVAARKAYCGGNAGRQRRFTEPDIVAINKMKARTAAQTRIKDEIRMTDVLSNFPKITASSPLSPVSYPGLDADSCGTKHVIIWKDRLNGTRVFSVPGTDDDSEALRRSYGSDETTFVMQFMKRHKCYDLMPNSSKLILFDVNLEVICALYALLYNGVKAAPIWDGKLQDFIGMLTVSDFIRVLQRLYRKKEDLDEVEEHKISDWRRLLNEDIRPMVSVDPEESLYDAVSYLRDERVHRLLVVDSLTGNALYVLTYKRILRFLHQKASSLPRPIFMSKSIYELGVGTYDDVSKVRLKSPLIDALNILMERRISAVPVVDDRDRLIDIYTKFDVINLARDQVYSNLDCTVEDALGVQRESFEGVYMCHKSDTLGAVIDWFITAEVHRMIIVDNARSVDGVISISDIIHYLVPRHSSPVTSVDGVGSDSELDSSGTFDIAL